MLVSTLCVISILVSAVAASIFDAPHVEILDSTNFKKVYEREDPTLVTFYAPWCGHCQRLSPAYAKAASNLAGIAGQFSAIDCDNDTNKQICGQHGIKGFPTIKLFPGHPRKAPLDYNGPRTAKALVDYMLDNQKSHVKRHFRPDKLSEALSPDNVKDKPLSILISPKSEIKPLYKALSNRLHKDIDFHFLVDSSDKAKANKEIKSILFSTTSLSTDRPVESPVLLFVSADSNDQHGINVQLYTGDFSLDKLRLWLKRSKKSSSKSHDEL